MCDLFTQEQWPRRLRTVGASVAIGEASAEALQPIPQPAVAMVVPIGQQWRGPAIGVAQLSRA